MVLFQPGGNTSSSVIERPTPDLNVDGCSVNKVFGKRNENPRHVGRQEAKKAYRAANEQPG